VIGSPVYIGKTGLIRQEALNYGFEPIEEEIESITMAGYYPGSKSIWIKIIASWTITNRAFTSYSNGRSL
jgi:hypothetical protein